MLDDVAALRRLDESRVLDRMIDYPAQFAADLHAVPDVAPLAGAPRLIVGGMGGSAVAGDLVRVWSDRQGTLPVVVSRQYRVPNWVGSETPVIVVSYSGRTSETLSQAQAAIKAGAPLGAVTSGGPLSNLVEEAGGTVVSVPAGLPRGPGHMGFLVAGIVSIADAWGLDIGAKSFDAAVARMGDWNAGWLPDVATDENPAKAAAIRFAAGTPVIVGNGALGRLAYRWANQFSENAKMFTLAGTLPEVDHNQIVGWDRDARTADCVFGLLTMGTEAGEDAQRVKITAGLMRERGKDLLQFKAAGDDVVARTLHMLMLGDWISVYLAFHRGFDPVPTPTIDRFKAQLAGMKAEDRDG